MFTYKITIDPSQIKPSYKPTLIISEKEFGGSYNQEFEFTDGMIVSIKDNPHFINNGSVIDGGTSIIVKMSSKNKRYFITPEISVVEFIPLPEYVARTSLQ